jgi:hypothetical protein
VALIPSKYNWAFFDLRRWPYFAPRQKVAAVLWGAQLLMPFVTFVAAWWKIDSILIIGPMLAAVGYAFAFATWRLHSWRLLAYGLSAPILTTAPILLVAAFRLPVQSIRTVVMLLIGIYTLTMAPLQNAALELIVRRSSDLGAKWASVPRWQFDLKSLFWMMSGLAALVVIARAVWAIMEDSVGPPLRIYVVVNLVFCGMLMQWFSIRYDK